MQHARSLPTLWLGILLPTLAAQDADASARQLQLPAITPIHTMPTDADAQYGVWAAGPTWKASFHDGYTFYPWVPDAERTLGWHWRTVTVTVGGEALLLKPPTMTTKELRCEYDLGGVVEAYDLREPGIEQTFVIETLPNRGELVVTGAVTSPFVAAARLPRVGPIDFTDHDGQAVLRYGTAKVFDANGRAAEVRTDFDGRNLRLVVDAAFLATAVLPITIDPLTSAVLVGASASTTMPVRATTIAADTRDHGKTVCTGCIRQFSSTDFDLFCYRYAEDTVAPTVTFADVATTNSVTKVDVCEVAGTSHFVWVIQRTYASAPVQCMVLAQTFSAALQSGQTFNLPSGFSDPQIGGSRTTSGTKALVVSTQTLGSGARRVRGQILQTTTAQVPANLTPPFDLHPSSNLLDSFDPAVTDAAVSTNAWGVAWISNLGSPGNNEVRVGLVRQDGHRSTHQSLGVWTNAREVTVAGADVRYMAMWLHTPPGQGSGVRSARYDQMFAPASLNLIQARQVQSSPLGNVSYQLGDLAFDYVTKSHWVSAVRTQTTGLSGTTNSASVNRHGYTGGIVETQPLATSSALGVGNVSVAYLGHWVWNQLDPAPEAATGFAVAYSTVQSSPVNPVWFRQFESAATMTRYGTSCAQLPFWSPYPGSDRPRAGHEFLRVSCLLGPSSPGFWLIGASTANTPLVGAGPTCTLLVNADVTKNFVTNANSQTVLELSLPDNPALLGHLYVQVMWQEPGVGLRSSNGFDFDIK